MECVEKILFEMRDYRVKMLKADEDLEDILKLCEGCLDYYELLGIKSVSMETAKEIFEDLPEGKEDNDKMVIGFYNKEGTLIGIIEGLRDYPQKSIWYIGQMMVAKDQRNKGLGKKFYKAFKQWAAEHNVKSIKLGVLEPNIAGIKFWEKMGFITTFKKDNFKIGNIETVVFGMEDKFK